MFVYVGTLFILTCHRFYGIFGYQLTASSVQAPCSLCPEQQMTQYLRHKHVHEHQDCPGARVELSLQTVVPVVGTTNTFSFNVPFAYVGTLFILT